MSLFAQFCQLNTPAVAIGSSIRHVDLREFRFIFRHKVFRVEPRGPLKEYRSVLISFCLSDTPAVAIGSGI